MLKKKINEKKSSPEDNLKNKEKITKQKK